MNIRAVTVDDAAAIAGIYRPIVETTIISFEDVAPDANEMKRRIAAITQTHPWIVACDGDMVLGYAYGSKHRERYGYRFSCDVSVYVAEHARGRGVGSALYAQLLDDLAKRGFHRAFAGIALPNDASIALHKRCGFELVGTYKEVGYKFGRWIDTSWWQRPL